jgi:hypothetical protein
LVQGAGQGERFHVAEIGGLGYVALQGKPEHQTVHNIQLEQLRGQFLKPDTALPARQVVEQHALLRIADAERCKSDLQLGVGAVVEEMG